MADFGTLPGGPPQGGGGDNPLTAGLRESANAAGMILGIYKPKTPDEARRLRRRFVSDAASIGAGAIASFATEGVAAPAAARAILSAIAGGGATGGVAAAIEGRNVPIGAATGAAFALPFAAIGPALGAAGKAASSEAEQAAAAKAASLSAADEMIAGRTPIRPSTDTLPVSGLEAPPVTNVGQRPPETLDLNEIIKNSRSGLRAEPPPITRGPVTPEEFAGASALTSPEGSGTPILTRMAAANKNPAFLSAVQRELALGPGAPFAEGKPIWGPEMDAQGNIINKVKTPADVSHVMPQWVGTPTEVSAGAAADFGGGVPPAAPPTASALIAEAGGKTPMTTQAINEAVQDFRTFIKDQYEGGSFKSMPRMPRSRMRLIGRRRGIQGYESEVENVGPANAIESLNGGVKGVLADMPIDETRFSRAWADIMKIYRRGIQIAGNAISKMGPSGQWLAKTMSDVVDRSERLASPYVLAVKKLSAGLSKDEIREVSGILNGDVVASGQRTAEVAARLRTLLDQVAQDAGDSGLREMSWRTGKVRPFSYMDNYFPYTYPKEVLKKYLTEGTPEQQAAIQRIMTMNVGADTPEKALLYLKRFLLTPPEFRYGHLQFARDLALPDFERDFTKVLPQYFQRAIKRIETAKAFGPTDGLAAKALRVIAADGYDYKMAADVYKAFADRAPRDYNALVHLTRTFNVISLLSTAGLVQFAQHANTIGYVGFKNFMKGLSSFMSKEGRDWAAHTGAYLQELMGEVAPDIGAVAPRNFAEQVMHLPFMPTNPALGKVITGPNRAAAWLQWIGLTPLDKANRMIAALAGRAHADQTAEKFFVQGSVDMAKALSRHGRELERLGLDAEQIMQQGGKLTEEQRLKAAQAVSHITQFRGSVLDMPAWKSTTVPGQFAYLFKTFSVQQFRYTNLLFQEAKKGNITPALRFIAASAAWTPAVGMAVRQLRGRPAPDNPYWNVIEASLNAGAVGIAYDGLRAAAEGPEFMLGFVTGPTALQAAELVNEGAKAVQGNSRPLLRDTLRHFPLIGPAMADYLVPKE